MKHLGDITKIKGCNAPVVDCIIGGSPCQDLSVAGKRAGLAGERSGLYMEQIRIIKEMRYTDEERGRTSESIRPRYMVWENVPGAFSSNQGKDFAAVLEEAIKVAEPEAPDVPVPEKGWPTSGCIMGDHWSVAWRVLDAQFWGVPQRRRRIALVADFGGQSAPEILFIRKGVPRDLDESQQARKATAGDAENCAGTDDRQRAVAEAVVFDARGNGDGTIAPTITGDHNNRVTDYTCVCCEPTIAYCIGNGQVNDAVQAEKELCKTLNCMADPMKIMQIVGTYQETGIGWWNGEDIGATLRAMSGGDAMKANLVVAGVDCRNMNEYPELYPTLQAKPNGGQSLNFSGAVRVRYIVRRLTPLECERLQGFPDGWTDIPEWVDSKGKRHKMSDSARYKALGNSIALPPWKWVLKRLCACYERDATMASLFDGIGGFPYIWEQLNGKGSCLWASEIEEFPMAVTKLRFGGNDNENNA